MQWVLWSAAASCPVGPGGAACSSRSAPAALAERHQNLGRANVRGEVIVPSNSLAVAAASSDWCNSLLCQLNCRPAVKQQQTTFFLCPHAMLPLTWTVHGCACCMLHAMGCVLLCAACRCCGLQLSWSRCCWHQSRQLLLAASTQPRVQCFVSLHPSCHIAVCRRIVGISACNVSHEQLGKG